MSQFPVTAYQDSCGIGRIIFERLRVPGNLFMMFIDVYVLRKIMFNRS